MIIIFMDTIKVRVGCSDMFYANKGKGVNA